MKRCLVCPLLLSLVALVFPSAAIATELTPDQLHSAVQKICPVSGITLGEHGPPVKVLVGDQEEEVFLCCKACLNREIDPAHWATIHRNIATSQKICPVMEEALPAKAEWKIVEGRVVFVCCPACFRKIEKDPKTHLALIDSFYAASLSDEPTKE